MSDELKAAEALKKQVHLLGQALGEVLKKIGVIGGHNMTGPELLCAAEDFCANTPDHPSDDGEAVTVEWLESVGFRSWDGDEDEFELYLRIRDEIGWECRLAYQANGIYAVRMCDPEDVGRVLSSESVELLNTRNTKPELTRGDVRRLCAALGITLAESEAK